MACVTANLICPENRVVDGVAKLLTKTDLTAICRKSAFASLMAAEVSLQEAWDLMTLGEKNGVIDGVVKTRIFGKLSSRLALFLAKKQKEGLEGHVYKSIQEIVDAYKAELEIDASGMPSPIAAANAPGSSATCEAPVEMSSMSDPIFIAKEKGFKEGKCFTSKDHPGMVFKLESFSESSVTFKQQRAEGLHGPALLVVKAGFDDLILFQETKRKLQALLPPSDLIKFSVGHHATLLRDQERAAVYSELAALASTHAEVEAQAVRWYTSPSELRSSEAIKKGKLVLVPVTLLDRIAPTSATSPHIVNGTEFTWYLEAPPKIKSEKPSDWVKSSVAAAFWAMATDDDAENANMELKHMKCNGGKYTFPVWQNPRAIRAGELVVGKEPPQLAKKARV